MSGWYWCVQMDPVCPNGPSVSGWSKGVWMVPVSPSGRLVSGDLLCLSGCLSGCPDILSVWLSGQIVSRAAPAAVTVRQFAPSAPRLSRHGSARRNRRTWCGRQRRTATCRRS